MRNVMLAGAAAACLALMVGSAAAQVQVPPVTFTPPVNDVPRWYTITAPAGMAVVAHSLTTGQPVAHLPAGYKFLAFGADASVVTLAVAGQVAYVPVSVAAEAYPVPVVNTEWKAAGPTLEEQAERYRKEAKAAQEKGLEPMSLKQAKEARKLQAIQGQNPGAPGLGAGAAGRDGEAPI